MKDFFLPQRRKDTEILRELKKTFKNLCLSMFICGLFFLFPTNILSQKIAVLTPEKNEQTIKFVEKFAESLEENLAVIDLSLAENVLRIKELESPFNLSNDEAKNLGMSIGCNFFILIKSETLRRSSFQQNEFYEANAVFYLVSSKTGRLVFWTLEKFDENSPSKATAKLFASIEKFAENISKEINISQKKELKEQVQNIEEVPDENSPEAKGLRPPLPFRRIKPEYTRLASFYSVTATVDILVDVGADGKILRTEIVRWAGFGLDESVIKTVNEMIWRPSDRDGKTLPMRVLLRYNFKKIETEE